MMEVEVAVLEEVAVAEETRGLALLLRLPSEMRLAAAAADVGVSRLLLDESLLGNSWPFSAAVDDER